MNTPKGGCRKECEGTVIQIFSEKGELLYQEFKAGDNTVYLDKHGIELNYDDERLEFYAPYSMVQPARVVPNDTVQPQTIPSIIDQVRSTPEHLT